jgi:hypothetical protein
VANNLDPKWYGANGTGQGRPLGSRNRLSQRFLDDVLVKWEKHGAAALEQMRWRDPVAFCRMVAAIVPNQLQIDVTRSSLSPEQREELIEFYKQHLAKLEQRDQDQKQLLIEAKIIDGTTIN